MKSMHRIIIIFTVLLLIPFATFSQLQQNGPTDRIELGAFLDGTIQAQMEAWNVASTVISIVKDGELFFSKGYGYADVSKEIPVQPDKTLFQIASISKLFVWMAVMQLHEQGFLDLDADINQYCPGLQIGTNYDEPITMKHIMTHTAGFEDMVIGLYYNDPSSIPPLGELLRNEMPSRVRPPGDISSYSNHATGIAAYIVEQISQKSWNGYM